MTRKPNFAKFLLGTCVLAILFIGTWATTRVPLTSAKKSDASTTTTTSAIPKMVPGLSAPLSPATGTDLVTSRIELEGDVIDSPSGPPDDWATINCDGGTAVAKTGVINDGNNKTIFTGGGSKDNIDINPPGWQWKDGSTPPKDDLINGYAAKFVGATGDTILAFGAERSSNNGTAFIGVWFFKNTVSLDADGTFNGVHSIGDILVLNTFTQGGSFATAKVYEWVGDGGTCAAGDTLQKGGNLCDITNSAPAGSVLSISNASPITIPPGTCPGWAYPGGTVPTNAFFEGAINLDAFPALAGACFSSFLIETRSSSVVDAVLKDFILGQFNTCVAFDCGKVAAPTAVCEGATVDYTYTFHNTGGIAVTVDLSDDKLGSLYTGHSVAVGATDTFIKTSAGLSPPGTIVNTATFTVHSPGQADKTCTATASVLVHENPTAVVSGDNAYCASNVHLVTIQAVLTGTGPWTVTWSDGVVQTVTTSPATRQVNPSLTTTYTVTAVSDAFCSGTASGSATITVNPTPSVDQPGSQTLCNGESTTAITFTGSAGATFAWTNNTTSIGLGASGTGNIGSFTAVNTGTTNVVATITVTPTSGALCVGPSKQFTITVKPTPHVNQPASQELCNGASTSAVTFSGDVAGATYGWTNDTTSIGLAGSGTGNIGSFIATNSGTTNVVATITVTPTANGCAGPSKTFTITVKPTPTVEVCPTAADADSCTTDNDLLLEAVVSPGGGTVTYSWTRVGSTTVLGTGSTLLVTGPGTYRVDITRDGCGAFNTTHVGLCAGCSP